MTHAEWFALGAVFILVGLMALIAVKIERKRTEWTWLHPPDDDGISILDDPDGQDTR